VPQFLSTSHWLIAFGALNLVGLLVTTIFKARAFTSVWCAFAAGVSVLIYMHFHTARRQETRAA
jgi:hypothetical protein